MVAPLTKSEMLKLEPDTRAFTLVGAYMGYFAVLELAINDAVGDVLDIDQAKLSIITRNMSLNDKINTLRSLVNFYVFDKTKAKEFDNWALKARKISEARNIVAHTAFRASPKTDGVEFFTIEAKKQLKFAETDWSVDDFIDRIDEINLIDNNLRSIKSRMSLQRIAKALMDSPPKGALGGLFGLGSGLKEM
ncbi:hypothetical protein HRR99_03230 [Agrobacterium vaccinii]|uniref:hypothetical protein n=1 Tax=Agrobacterium vaccinii TaxID=2735528 RepID=UPI001E4731B9|nr:hypothetical protein [Agrobacterium vaccinii]UHS60600.1 hypothetical protein HRR99_03230 [Agrobacterium vaccinii]